MVGSGFSYWVFLLIMSLLRVVMSRSLFLLILCVFVFYERLFIFVIDIYCRIEEEICFVYVVIFDDIDIVVVVVCKVFKDFLWKFFSGIECGVFMFKFVDLVF